MSRPWHRNLEKMTNQDIEKNLNKLGMKKFLTTMGVTRQGLYLRLNKVGYKKHINYEVGTKDK